MDPPPAYLFVYGSLLAGQVGRRLLGEVTRTTAASVRGRLYHLPPGYPMLVWDEAGDRVEGDLVQLGDPVATLARLDAYEGFDPRDPAGSDYVRLTHRVQTDGGGEAVTAWIYIAPPHWAPAGHRIEPGPGGGVRWDRDRPRRRPGP